MSCKYKIGNKDFNSKKELKEYFSQRKNITKEVISTFGGNTSTTITPYKNTDQWVGLATRRVLQMASQEGYDGVAFATGEQSADMYSLAKQVDNISWNTSDNTLTAKDKEGKTQFLESNVTEDQLEKYVGKEVAQKLIDIKKEKPSYEDLTNKILNLQDKQIKINQEISKNKMMISDEMSDSEYDSLRNINKQLQVEKDNISKEIKVLREDLNSGVITLDNAQLEIGGEGMKTFYNQIVPKVVQKEAQRFDKDVRISEVDFNEQNIKYDEELYLDLQWQISDFFEGDEQGLEEANLILNNWKDNPTINNYNSVRDLFNSMADSMEGSREDLRFEQQLEQSVNIDKLALSKQPFIPITGKMKEGLQGAIPQFQKNLAEKGIKATVNGFVHNNDIYINSDVATNEVYLHEYSHLLNSWYKQNKPEAYQRGLQLIEQELQKENSEIQDVIDFVKSAQPNLTGEALLEELLTETIGRKSNELIESKRTDSPIMQWLSELWNELKNILGLRNMSASQLANMTLGEYVNAFSKDLLAGEKLQKNLNNQNDTRLRNRKRWNPSRGNQTLEGAPIIKTRGNVTGADPELTFWAEEYARRNGIEFKRQSVYVEVDEERAKRIAQAYEEMEHKPQDPKVKEAYQNLIDQTLAQYNILVEAGYQFYFFDETNDPYNGNPWAAMEDLRNNKVMAVFATEAGYGSLGEDLNVKDNPMLADTGLEWSFGSLNGQKKRVLANDLFRAVHDAFGHGIEGAGFRARGEENAWQAHARLFTGSARATITTETRGQNSWLNYGKFGEQNRTAKVEDTIFADQKIGLMPEWTWTEGFDEGVSETTVPEYGTEEFKKLTPEQQANSLGYVLDRKGSKVADGEGNFKYEKSTELPVSDVVDKSMLTDSQIKLLEFSGIKSIKMYGGRAVQGIGFYNMNGKFVAIDVNNKLGGAILSNQEEVNRLILHESIHAIIDNSGNKEIINSELTNIVEKLKLNKNSSSPYVQRVISFIEKGSNEEVLTYMLTTPELAEFMGTIRSDKSVDGSLSLWGQLVEAIKRIIQNKTILDEAVNILESFAPVSLQVEIQSQKAIEPNLSFEALGETFNNYPDALKFSKGSQIKANIEEVNIAELDGSVSNLTFEGTINGLVKANLLTGERILEKDGSEVYVTVGNSFNRKLVNAVYVAEKMKKLLGSKNVKQLDDNNFTFNNTLDQRTIGGQTTTTEEINEMTYEQMVEKFGEENAITLLAEKTYKEYVKPFGGKKVLEEAQEFIPENELQISLLNLLNSMGVKTMSLSNYIEAYKKRNGVEPSASALADIANKVVAFKDGQITEELLSEEVAHFILEAVDQARLEPLLKNIHRTQEWQEHSENYMQIYNNEVQVRKEILGKVLANSLRNQYQASTPIQQSIFDNLMQIFQDFVKRIQDFFKPQYQKDLDLFNEQIYNNLLANDLINELNLEQLEGNKLMMYSAATSTKTPLDVIEAKSRKAVELLSSQDRKLHKSPTATRQQLIEVSTQLDGQNKLMALSGIAKVAKKHVRYLETVAKQNKGKKFLFSQEENAVYSSTVGSLNRWLKEINQMLDSSTKEERIIKEEVEKTILDIDGLEGTFGNIQNNAWEQIVEELAVKHNLTPQAKQELLDSLKGTQKDTNWFFANISNMVHAQNPLLNAASHVISKMHTTATINSNEENQRLVNELEAIGFNPRDLKKFKDGAYLLAEIDFERYEKDLLEFKVKTYNEGREKPLTEEEFLKLESENGLFQSTETEKSVEFYEKVAEFQEENQKVSALKEEVKKQRKELLAKYSKEVQRIDKRFSRQMSDVFREARDNGGFTKELRFRLEEINGQRQLLKSPFGVNGQFKSGLKLNPQGEIVLDETKLLSQEAQIAYELDQLDKERFKKKEDKGIPQAFKDRLNQEQNPEEFFFLNANVAFSDKFWDKMANDDTVAKKLDKKGTKKAEDIAEKIREVSLKRSYILRQYKVSGQPAEINYSNMTGNDILSVKELTDLLQTYYSEAQKELNEKQVETVASAGVSVVNDAYLQAVQDEGLVRSNMDAFLDFIRQHTSTQDKIRIDQARAFADEYVKGYRDEIPKRFAKVFSGSKDVAVLNEEVLRYAEGKLLPYFKRFEPSTIGKTGMSFTNIINQVKSGIRPVNEFLAEYEQGMYPEINVAPNFIFFAEQENSDLNPEFVRNQELGLPQIKKDRYENKRYTEYFGMVNGQPTKNLMDFKALNILLKHHEKTIALTDKVNHNKWLLPQKGMRGTRQWQELAKKAKLSTVKEIIKDMTTYREDEKEYGERLDGSAMSGNAGDMRIPTYGFSKLSNQEDVTDELLLSYTWMHNEAQVYSARVEAFAEMEAIKGTILNTTVEGKEITATNLYKMFDSFYRFNIYGQNETFSYETDFGGLLSKKMNLAPLAKKFQGWIRLVNLGWSVIVPFTSLLQGSVNFIIEKAVGERINADASKLARKKISNLLGESVSDSLALTSKSKLNVIGEYFGVFSAQERFNNSNYNKFTRGLVKSSYLTHTLGDAPIKAQVMGTVLHDFRVVDGEIMNYSQYKRQRRAQDNTLSEKQIRADWKLTEGNAIFDYIDVRDGILNFDKARLEKELNKGTEFDSYFNLKVQAIKDFMSVAVQELDTMIPAEQRSVAQRHAVLSFLFLHKSWLTVAYNRKLKGRHLNLLTGEMEEGNYSGTARFVAQMIKEYKSSDKTKSFINHLKDSWKNADETTRRSLHRTMTEVAITNTMIALTIILANIADDDDDDYMAEFAAYMMYRTTNEMMSQTTALPNQVAEFVKSPVVGVNVIQNLVHAGDLGSSEVIGSGRFKGETERMRFIFKAAPGLKEYYNLTRVDRTRDAYQYYNKSNMKWSILAMLASEETLKPLN